MPKQVLALSADARQLGKGCAAVWDFEVADKRLADTGCPRGIAPENLSQPQPDCMCIELHNYSVPQLEDTPRGKGSNPEAQTLRAILQYDCRTTTTPALHGGGHTILNDVFVWLAGASPC